MMRRYRPIDPAKIKTYSVGRRAHLASVTDASPLPGAGASAAALMSSFPETLGAAAFRRVVGAIAAAVRHERPVVMAMGAHVLKVGCGPLVVDLIRRGIVTAVAGHGATAIHDVELALWGRTSEDVADTIRDGRFGMVSETMEFFDTAVGLAARESLGLGQAVGRLLVERKAEYRASSVFAAAFEAAIPASVHVAFGTDTIHSSPGLDAAALGTATMHDFHLVCDVVGDLGAGADSGAAGVWLNVGSAVILPEVFLKAVSVARNLGADLDAMTTANFDMIRHYRPYQNVVLRPVAAGRGNEVIGQHELLLPLFRQAVVNALAYGDQS